MCGHVCSALHLYCSNLLFAGKTKKKKGKRKEIDIFWKKKELLVREKWWNKHLSFYRFSICVVWLRTDWILQSESMVHRLFVPVRVCVCVSVRDLCGLCHHLAQPPKPRVVWPGREHRGRLCAGARWPSVISSHNCMGSHKHAQRGWERDGGKWRCSGWWKGFDTAEAVEVRIKLPETKRITYTLRFFRLIWSSPRAPSLFQSNHNVLILTAKCVIFRCKFLLPLLKTQ